MAKREILLSTHEEVQAFVTYKTTMFSALNIQMQLAMTNSEVVSTCNMAKANWGDVGALLQTQFQALEDVKSRCSVKPKDMDKASWDDYFAQSKVAAMQAFNSIIEFCKTLTVELIASAPTVSRKSKADKSIKITWNGETVEPVYMLGVPEFCQALATAGSLAQFYSANSIGADGQFAIWQAISNVAKRDSTNKRVRRSSAELQAMLDSGKNEAGNDFTDAQKLRLAEAIAKAKAREAKAPATTAPTNEVVTTPEPEPQADTSEPQV